LIEKDTDYKLHDAISIAFYKILTNETFQSFHEKYPEKGDQFPAIKSGYLKLKTKLNFLK